MLHNQSSTASQNTVFLGPLYNENIRLCHLVALSLMPGGGWTSLPMAMELPGTAPAQNDERKWRLLAPQIRLFLSLFGSGEPFLGADLLGSQALLASGRNLAILWASQTWKPSIL